MSGWTEIEHEDVQIKHHSTASVISITITTDEDDGSGGVEKHSQSVWVDYRAFSDLREAINKIEFLNINIINT